MSFNRKYAGLPDLVRYIYHTSLLPHLNQPTTNIVCLGQDLAPDIYETPDLTDEASTVPVSYPASRLRLPFPMLLAAHP